MSEEVPEGIMSKQREVLVNAIKDMVKHYELSYELAVIRKAIKDKPKEKKR